MMQKMTQERMQLSADMSKKSILVKRLIEENAALREQLRKAQEESSKILRFSQGGN